MTKEGSVVFGMALALVAGCGAIDDPIDDPEVDGAVSPDAGLDGTVGFTCPAGCARLGPAEMCACEQRLDWLAARDACAASGLVLARVGDQYAATLVRTEYERIGFPLWVGGTDAGDEGRWRWEKGGDLFWIGVADGGPPAGQFADFHEGEPNNYGGAENCTEVVTGWNDVSCDLLRPYLCEAR